MRTHAHSRLDTAAGQAVVALARQATAVDGVAPLSEQVRLQVRDGVPPTGVHLLVPADAPSDGLLAYAHLQAPEPDATGTGLSVAELVVSPAHRRAGHGAALLQEALSRSGTGGLRVWAHGDLPAARALAASAGFAVVRTLLNLRRPLDDALPPVTVRAGVSLRTFDPGADDEAWLRVNASAFAHHPEQGSWTAADLAARQAEPWFDPAGLIVAYDTSTGRVLGFHWTKIDPAAGAGIGEVYVVAVDPQAHGGGLGTAVTLAGLHHLRAAGMREAMLYVDGDNTAALRVYQRLGFTERARDVMYAGADALV